MKCNLHIMFPEQVTAIYYNIILGVFQWKTSESEESTAALPSGPLDKINSTASSVV